MMGWGADSGWDEPEGERPYCKKEAIACDRRARCDNPSQCRECHPTIKPEGAVDVATLRFVERCFSEERGTMLDEIARLRAELETVKRERDDAVASAIRKHNEFAEHLART